MELENLEKTIEKIKSEQDKADGALETLFKQMETQFKVKTLEGLQKLHQENEAEIDQIKQEIEEALQEYDAKYS